MWYEDVLAHTSVDDWGFDFLLLFCRCACAGDMGRMWYEDGKYLKKRNTFTDFIACAEHLIKVRMHMMGDG
jgi:oligopeptidase B